MKDAKRVTVALRLNGLPEELAVALRDIASAVLGGNQWSETNLYVGPEPEAEKQISSPRPAAQALSPRPTVRALSPEEADDALLAREIEKFNDLLAEGLRDTSVDPRVAPRLVRIMQDCGWSTEEKQMSDGSIAVKVWPADKDGNPRVCEDCGGKLGPTFIDEHQPECPRFPL